MTFFSKSKLDRSEFLVPHSDAPPVGTYDVFDNDRPRAAVIGRAERFPTSSSLLPSPALDRTISDPTNSSMLSFRSSAFNPRRMGEPSARMIQVQKYREQVNGLNMRLRTERQLKKDVEKEVELLQGQVDDANSALTSMEAEREEINRQYEMLLQEKRDVDMHCEALHTRIADTAEEIRQLNDRHAKVEREHNAAANEMKVNNERIQNVLNAEIINVRCKVDELSAALFDAKAKMAEKDDKNSKKQAKVEQLESEISALESRLQSYASDIVSAETKNAELDERRANLVQELAETKAQLDSAVVREAKLLKENEQISAQSAQRAEQIAAAMEHIESVEAQVERMSEEYSEISSKLQAEIGLRQARDATIVQLESEREVAKQEHETQQAELRKELTEAKDKASQIQHELDDLQSQYEEVSEEIASLHDNHTDLLHVFETEQERRVATETEAAVLRETVDEVRVQATKREADLFAEQARLEQEIADKVNELDFEQFELDELEYAVDELTELLSNTEQALADEVSARKDVEAQLDEARNKITERDDMLARHSERIAMLSDELKAEVSAHFETRSALENIESKSAAQMQQLNEIEERLAETAIMLESEAAAHDEMRQVHERVVDETTAAIAARDEKIEDLQETVQELSAQNRKTDDRMRNLAFELQQTKAQFDDAKARIASDSASVIELRADIRREIQRNEAAEEKLQQMSEAKENLATALSQQQSATASIKSSKKELEASYAHTLAKYEGAQSELQTLREKHASSVAALESRVSSLTSDIGRLESNSGLLQEKLLKMESQRDEARAQYAEASQQLRDEKRMHAEARDIIAQATVKIHALDGDMSALRSAGADLRGTANRLENELAFEQESRAGVQDALNVLRERFESTDAELEAEKEAHRVASQRACSLESCVAEQQTTLEQLEAKLSETTTLLGQMEGELKETIAKKAQLDSTVSSQASEIARLTQSIGDTSEHADVTAMERDAARAQAAALDDKCNAFSTELSQTQGALEKTQEALSAQHTKVASLSEQLTAVRQQAAELDEECERLRERTALQDASQSATAQELVSREEKLQEFESTYKTAQATILTLQEELQNSMLLAENQQHELSSTASDIAKKEEDLARMTESASTLREQLTAAETARCAAERREEKALADAAAVHSVNTELRTQVQNASRLAEERGAAAEAESARRDKMQEKLEKNNEKLMQIQQELMQARAVAASAEAASDDFRICLDDESQARVRAEDKASALQERYDNLEAEFTAKSDEVLELRRKIEQFRSVQMRADESISSVKSDAEKDHKRVKQLMEALRNESKLRRDQQLQMQQQLKAAENEAEILRAEMARLKEHGGFTDKAVDRIDSLSAAAAVSGAGESELRRQNAALQKKIKSDGELVQATKKAARDLEIQKQHAEESLKQAHSAAEQMRAEFAEREAKLEQQLQMQQEDLEKMRAITESLIKADVGADEMGIAQSVAEAELEALREEAAELGGHANTKQKIKYHHRLREENQNLAADVTHLARELKARDAKIEQLTQVIDQLSGLNDKENTVSAARAKSSALAPKTVNKPVVRRTTKSTKPVTPQFATNKRNLLRASTRD